MAALEPAVAVSHVRDVIGADDVGKIRPNFPRGVAGAQRGGKGRGMGRVGENRIKHARAEFFRKKAAEADLNLHVERVTLPRADAAFGNGVKGLEVALLRRVGEILQPLRDFNGGVFAGGGHAGLEQFVHIIINAEEELRVERADRAEAFGGGGVGIRIGS